jgi:hypothetical protein
MKKEMRKFERSRIREEISWMDVIGEELKRKEEEEE